MKRKKLLSVAGVGTLILALIVLPLLGFAKPAPAQTKSMILGMSSPFSGFAATWGIYCFRSLELLAAEYNERGGLNIKGEKYLIKLISYDDKYDATEGQIIARRLINVDKVDIFTVFSGGAATAAREVSRAAGRFQLGTSWAGNEPNPDFPLVFARNIRYPENVNAGTSWFAKKNPEIKKLAKIGPNSPFGKMSAEMVKYAGPKAGIEVVASELFEPGVVDFMPLLLKRLELKPGVIDVTACPPDSSALIVKQAKELGYNGKFVHWSGANFEVAFGIVGAAVMEGVISGIEYGEPYTPRQQAFKERYLKKYGSPWVSGIFQHLPAHEILLQAIEKAQTWESQALANTMRGGEFDTHQGKARFGGKEFYGINNQPLYPMYIATAKGGKSVHVDAVQTGDNYPRK